MGGRPIKFTGHRAADKLRKQMLEIGVTMTELAEQLGVHKSDISHALSPRCAKKRYIKLRSRIRQTLKKLWRKFMRLDPTDKTWRFIDYYTKRMPVFVKHYYNIIETVARHLAYYCLPIPPVGLAQEARIWSKHPSTLYKTLYNRPGRFSENTRKLAKHIAQYLPKILILHAEDTADILCHAPTNPC